MEYMPSRPTREILLLNLDLLMASSQVMIVKGGVAFCTVRGNKKDSLLPLLATVLVLVQKNLMREEKTLRGGGLRIIYSNLSHSC